jgi:hypothetical protein
LREVKPSLDPNLLKGYNSFKTDVIGAEFA